jgi:CRP-like cAMP-binding protein
VRAAVIIAPPPPPPVAQQAPVEPPQTKRRTLPPGATLDQISLGKVIPGARESQEIVQPPGTVFEIPLDEDGFDAAFADAVDGVEEIEELDEHDAVEEPPPTRPSAPSTAARTAAALFPRTPLFSSLDAPRLRMLIERVRLMRLAPNETLFSQGEAGDSLYVIADGEVRVIVDDHEVGRLREGAFFGEIALITSQPRSATIRAVTETTLLAIDREVISDLVEASPEVLRVLLRFMRDRLLATLIDTSPLFAPYTGDERIALASKFRFLEVEAGSRIVNEGEKTPGLFILLAGRADVVLRGKKINELDGGDLFGELSLLTHGNAVATILAASRVYLLELPRTAFQEVIMTHPQVLEYVNTLAEERRRQLEAIARGEAGYREGRLRVV